jgi:hypothetical protein
MVVETGIYELPNGNILQAGTINIDDNWDTPSLAANFTETPVILSQCMSYNGDDAVVTRQRNISTSSFQVKLQEEEAQGNHNDEIVGWIAIESGSGELDGNNFTVNSTGNAVTHNWYGINHRVSSASVCIAAMQTYDGGDPATLRYQNLNDSSVEVKVEEETSNDSETNHTTEIVGYFVADGTGNIVGEQSMGKILTTSETGENDNIPKEFALLQNYPNPFNPTTTIKYGLPKGVKVNINIYDIRGRLITQLVNGYQPAGRYTVTWDASQVGSGVYFYKIEAGSFREVKKCLFIK